jgi:hypothetical protein
MGYKGIVKGNVVLLEAGVQLPDGLQVDINPMEAPRQGHTHEAKTVRASMDKYNRSLPPVLRWVA